MEVLGLLRCRSAADPGGDCPRPDCVTFNAVIDACAHGVPPVGGFAVGVQVLEQMEADGVCPRRAHSSVADVSLLILANTCRMHTTHCF